MSLTGFLARFLALYVSVAVGLLVALSYLGNLGAGWSQSGVLIVVTYFLCVQFGERNRRYFTKTEKFSALAAIALVDLVLQVVRTFAGLLAKAKAAEGIAGASYGEVTFGVVAAVIVHILALLFIFRHVELKFSKSGAILG